MTYYWNRKTCAFCGNEFRASRSDAKFCGPTCRKSHSRRKESIDHLKEKTEDNLRWLGQQAKRYPDLIPHIERILIDLSGFAMHQVEVVTPATVTDSTRSIK